MSAPSTALRPRARTQAVRVSQRFFVEARLETTSSVETGSRSRASGRPFCSPLLHYTPRLPDSLRTLPRTSPRTRYPSPAVIRTPVLIVGASPSGGTLSALLGSMGVPHILLDQASHLDALRDSPSQEHVVSRRSMEIFRALDRFDHTLQLRAAPPSAWRYSSYGTCVDIKKRWTSLLALQDHWMSADDGRFRECSPDRPSLSPNSVVHLPERRLVAELLEYALGKGWLRDAASEGLWTSVAQRSPDALPQTSGCLALGTQWVAGFSGCLGVESLLYHAATEQYLTCESGFLIGADGSRSAVRRHFLETEGVRMEDLGRRRSAVPPPRPSKQATARIKSPASLHRRPSDGLVHVNFVSSDLARLCAQVAPGVRRHTVYNKDGITQLFVQDLTRGLFASRSIFFPDHQSFGRKYNPVALKRQLDHLAGSKLSDIDLKVSRRVSPLHRLNPDIHPKTVNLVAPTTTRRVNTVPLRGPLAVRPLEHLTP